MTTEKIKIYVTKKIYDTIRRQVTIFHTNIPFFIFPFDIEINIPIAGIHDIDRVNAILAAHEAKTFPSE